MIRKANNKEVFRLVEYMEGVPFDVTRDTLYSPTELYEGYDPKSDSGYDHSLDQLVYAHYMAKGKQKPPAEESMARALHDHGMHTAMNAFFDAHDARRCIGIMGGHALLRTDAMYSQVVMLSKELTEKGFHMLSGGGPGAMEATHLGAWLAGRSEAEADEALTMLSAAPSFRDKGWLRTAFEVRERFPQHEFVSLGIPTWLYGHEPTTVFATHIAKFFENSIREDSLLTLSYGGIVYTPGSAGTIQEIFQEAVQNHYLSLGFSSPMIFMGERFWTEEMPVYPLLEQLKQTGMYKNLLLTLTDEPKAVVEELVKFRELLRQGKGIS